MRRHTIYAVIAMSFCALGLAVSSASAAPPTILLSTFSAVTSHSVALESEINPGGKATTYRFEYGPSNCAANPCTRIPIPDGKIPAGVIGVPVAANVEGLSPATTYHFRVLAKGEGLIEGPDRTFTTYAVPPQGLSDERAYEQASPVNKNGGDATGSFWVLKAARQGGAVTFLGTSGIPGGCGAQELPVYLASRGATSWSSQGLLPCASFGQRSRMLGWTPDFSQVFTVATKLGSPQTDTLLARSSADGSITTVVPHLPTGYSYAASSADGAEAIFESPSQLPGVGAAIEGASNVYAWDKASGKISLASALGDGSSPPKGAFAGPYDWVHGTTPTTLARGGAANGYYLQDTRAVSADGSVFFTAAGTGQLYLRRNPTAKPLSEGKCAGSALACTIHVSASQKKDGTGPGGTDAAGTRPAAFTAASADGSKAFFTSSEKLTNDANTGVEPVLPAIARANIDGSGTDLSFLPATAGAIAVDGEHIYWANPQAGAIGRAKLNGSEVNTEFIAGANNPQGIAVDGEHIYWTNPGLDEPGEGAIGRAALNGGEVDQEFIAAAGHPRGVAVDGEHIYWTNAALEYGEPGFVGRATLEGETVEAEFIETFFIPGVEHAAKLSGIAVDGSHLYWIDGRAFEPGHLSNWLSRANLDGSGYERQFNGLLSFPDGSTSPHGVAVDATHVYWTEEDASAIARIKVDGTDKEQFIQNAAHPRGLAIDATQIYWSANQGAEANPGNDLYRYETATGKLSDLSVDKTHTNGAEVKGVLGASEDGAYLYYAANGVPEGVVNSPNGRGESASLGDCKGNLASMTGTCNLYLWHEGESAFIARLGVGGSSATDAANWTPTPTGVFLGNLDFRKTASVSPDGQTLLFRSQRQLDDYENAGTPELYLYHAGEAGPSCVSCNPTGAPPSGAPSLGTLGTTATIPQEPAAVASRNLAAGGERVFFESTDALVAADTNGEAGCPPVGSSQQRFPVCLDVYEWEAKGTGTCQSESENGGCLYLLSTGKSTWPSFFADASADGDEAFFFTREGLVGQDKDELLDVYDAKVGGGLAAQNRPEVTSCESAESCHGPPSQAPASESPASATFVGPADPTPKHAKKQKKKKKKAHHKKKRGKAHANRKGQR